MTYSSIQRACSFNLAVAKYNAYYDTNLRLRHIRILLLLSASQVPPNRLEIVSRLSKGSFSINYKQLNHALVLLEDAGYISSVSKGQYKTYMPKAAGFEVLGLLERTVRKMRFDRC